MATAPPAQFDHARQLAIVQRAIAKQSACVLATSSAKNRPHAVVVLYAAVDLSVYCVVGEDTIKVRNVRENPNVAVSIPVRKYPFAPPMAVQFQGTGEVLPKDDPHIQELLKAGRLKRITTLNALDNPHACFIKVTPRRRISSYGLGVSLLRVLRDPTQGTRSVELP
jgi:general stress protein 26